MLKRIRASSSYGLPLPTEVRNTRRDYWMGDEVLACPVARRPDAPMWEGGDGPVPGSLGPLFWSVLDDMGMGMLPSGK